MDKANRHATLLLGILIGFALGVVVGMWSPEVGRPLWVDSDCVGPAWYCFAYSWQTLIAGSAALFGAAWTVKKIQKQIELAHWEHATKEIDDLREELKITSFLRAIVSSDLLHVHSQEDEHFTTTLFNFDYVFEKIPSERFCEKSAEYESQIKLQTGGPEATRRRLGLKQIIEETIDRTKVDVNLLAFEWDAYRHDLGEERGTPNASVPEDARNKFIEKSAVVVAKYKALGPFLEQHGDFIASRIATLADTYMLKE